MSKQNARLRTNVPVTHRGIHNQTHYLCILIKDVKKCQTERSLHMEIDNFSCWLVVSIAESSNGRVLDASEAKHLSCLWRSEKSNAGRVYR